MLQIRGIESTRSVLTAGYRLTYVTIVPLSRDIGVVLAGLVSVPWYLHARQGPTTMHGTSHRAVCSKDAEV